MKTAGIFEAKQSLSDYVDQAQEEVIVLTKHGKPAAVMIGVEGLAFEAFLSGLEDLTFATDPKFWAMIKSRRASKAERVPMEEVRRRLRQKADRESASTKATSRAPRRTKKSR